MAAVTLSGAKSGSNTGLYGWAGGDLADGGGKPALQGIERGLAALALADNRIGSEAAGLDVDAAHVVIYSVIVSCQQRDLDPCVYAPNYQHYCRIAGNHSTRRLLDESRVAAKPFIPTHPDRRLRNSTHLLACSFW